MGSTVQPGDQRTWPNAPHRRFQPDNPGIALQAAWPRLRHKPPTADPLSTRVHADGFGLTSGSQHLLNLIPSETVGQLHQKRAPIPSNNHTDIRTNRQRPAGLHRRDDRFNYRGRKPVGRQRMAARRTNHHSTTGNRLAYASARRHDTVASQFEYNPTKRCTQSNNTFRRSRGNALVPRPQTTAVG